MSNQLQEELLYLIALSKLKPISDLDKKNLLTQHRSAKQVHDYCKSFPALNSLHWPIDLAKKEIDFISKHSIKAISILDTELSLIHISEPTRLRCISYAVFCLKKIFFLMIRRPPRSTLD